jgi:GTPase
MQKAAFVTLLGMPNSGKSTLLNALLNESLVITNKKAQTTRHRIKGIISENDTQLVVSDTPGFIEKAAYKMQEQMMEMLHDALSDADILVIVIDGKSDDELDSLIQLSDSIKCDKCIVINKIDLMSQEEVLEKIVLIKEKLSIEQVIPLSAVESFNVDALKQFLMESAPEHPFYYDADIISDANMRFHITEFIRETVLTQFEKEIPYCTHVVINEYEEGKKLDRIFATIYVERESQKPILLGKGGAAIKKLGIKSRERIEGFLGKKIFLDLSVKVRENWRSNETHLKNFGFITE